MSRNYNGYVFEPNAVLTGLRLHGAELSGADLKGANLEGADLTRADLTGADLRNANLRGARLDRADLAGALLDGADLTGVSAPGARFAEASLLGCKLVRASLFGADFMDARFDDADLSAVDAAGANFTGCTFRSALAIGGRFWGARLAECDLSLANFMEADLTRVDFTQAIFEGASFKDAILMGVDLSRAEAVDEAVVHASVQHAFDEDDWAELEDAFDDGLEEGSTEPGTTTPEDRLVIRVRRSDFTTFMSLHSKIARTSGVSVAMPRAVSFGTDGNPFLPVGKGSNKDFRPPLPMSPFLADIGRAVDRARISLRLGGRAFIHDDEVTQKCPKTSVEHVIARIEVR